MVLCNENPNTNATLPGFLHNKPCSDVFDFNCTFDHRDHCQKLSHDELDLVIKAQHVAHRFYGQHIRAKYLKKENRSIKSTFSMNYRFADTPFVLPMVFKEKTASHSYFS